MKEQNNGKKDIIFPSSFVKWYLIDVENKLIKFVKAPTINK